MLQQVWNLWLRRSVAGRSTTRRKYASLLLVPVLAFALDRLFPLPPAPHYSPLVLAADGTENAEKASSRSDASY